MVDVVQNVQSAVLKMRKSIEDLETSIQSSNIGAQDNASLDRASADPNNCVCKSLKQDILEAIDKKFADLTHEMKEKVCDDSFGKKLTKQLMDFNKSENKDLLNEIKQNSKSIKTEIMQEVRKDHQSLKQEMRNEIHQAETNVTRTLTPDLTSLCNEVNQIKSWQNQMSPVLSEILTKTKIAMYSNTQINESLHDQKNRQIRQGQDMNATQNKLTTIEQATGNLTSCLDDLKIQSLDKLDDVKLSIDQQDLTTTNNKLTTVEQAINNQASCFDDLKSEISHQLEKVSTALPEIAEKREVLENFTEIKHLIKQQKTTDGNTGNTQLPGDVLE